MKLENKILIMLMSMYAENLVITLEIHIFNIYQSLIIHEMIGVDFEIINWCIQKRQNVLRSDYLFKFACLLLSLSIFSKVSEKMGVDAPGCGECKQGHKVISQVTYLVLLLLSKFNKNVCFSSTVRPPPTVNGKHAFCSKAFGLVDEQLKLFIDTSGGVDETQWFFNTTSGGVEEKARLFTNSWGSCR